MLRCPVSNELRPGSTGPVESLILLGHSGIAYTSVEQVMGYGDSHDSTADNHNVSVITHAGNHNRAGRIGQPVDPLTDDAMGSEVTWDALSDGMSWRRSLMIRSGPASRSRAASW